MLAVASVLFLTGALLSRTVHSEDQNITGGLTCQVQGASDTQNLSVVTCIFPAEVSLFQVDFYSETGRYSAPIISCSPCRLAEEFADLITFRFPENQTQADTWAFEVTGSRNTAGVYTCYGNHGGDKFRSAPCNVAFPLVTDVPQTSHSLDDTNEESSGSQEMIVWILIPVLNIFFVITSIIVLCCFLYRCKLPRCKGEAAYKRQYGYQPAESRLSL